MKNPIIVLTGPTASGKTAMSYELAKKFNCEIICADSMTVYKGMDIGTDKATLDSTTKVEEGYYLIHGIRHHMLDRFSPDEEFNAAIFKDVVGREVEQIRSRGKVPMLVGGSLLYIDSYIYDFSMPEVEPDQELRKALEAKSNEELFKELVALDPDAEWTIDPNNKRRLIRALEVCMKSGQPFTAQKSKKELPKNVIYLAVERDREDLYERINKRVDQMMQEGFLDEAKSLYEKYDHSTAMQATGYRQLIQYLNGEVTLDEAIEKTKQSHRNFAKKQLTWLRRNRDVQWVKTESEAEEKIERFLQS